ncbi:MULTISPECIES: hypothetical protein, partial [unclassified Microcoleus]|uniref:hypothetical protein n=1 Tax=unclassified Microcoleus TaxID=2642155 RepID=UPI002FD06720
SCTLFSLARSKPFATQYALDYSASPIYSVTQVTIARSRKVSDRRKIQIELPKESPTFLLNKYATYSWVFQFVFEVV